MKIKMCILPAYYIGLPTDSETGYGLARLLLPTYPYTYLLSPELFEDMPVFFFFFIGGNDPIILNHENNL